MPQRRAIGAASAPARRKQKPAELGARAAPRDKGRRLAREKHDITIIDEDQDLVDQVSTDLDVRGYTGHAAHPDVLKRAGAAHVSVCCWEVVRPDDK